jgi:hypothetical protein
MGFFGTKQEDKDLIFESNYLGCVAKVYPDRLELRMLIGKDSIPLDQIASIEQTPMLSQILVETSGGKKYKVVTLKKKELAAAIHQAKAGTSQSQPSGSVADELSKLVELRYKGILTLEEFDAQKKKLLG